MKGCIDKTEYIVLFGEGTNLGNKLISVFRNITCIGGNAPPWVVKKQSVSGEMWLRWAFT